jgi:YVTN family beta-propeller protein
VSGRTEIGIGSEFVGYRIDELIGRGGMGVVYRAYDLRLKRTVALKLMAPELALDRRFRERFSREAELAMSLEHPNVVPIHDAGDIDGRLYLAMRHVEGTDLRVLLHAEGALDPPRALAICSQVANALDAAHANGLVHRDVKPSNVLLDASEHVYLADFGLTRRLDEQGGPVGDGRSVGTPAYLAPEQIDGESVDGRADVYSLGCLLYECLTGEAPFVRGSQLAVAWAHLEEEPPRASRRRPELPEAIDAAICKAMAKEPADRSTTCTALITAAEEALELRRPPARLPRKRTIAAAGAILVLLAAVLTAAVLIRGTAGGGVATPTVTDDTLVRIDPATNKVDRVIEVGRSPSAVAVGGRTVWVYNDGNPSVSEIDAATGTPRHTTSVIAAPTHLDPFSGPVLAANAAGAWLVGTDGRGRSYLTRLVSGPHGKREYRLEQVPLAVEVGYDAVWVITRGDRDDHLLRIDPATGKVTKRTAFPASAKIDGLAAGLGNVWVGASSKATLYRINPRSAGVTGQIDLGERADRPSVVLGSIWVDVSDRGGDTLIVDPRGDLSVNNHLGCCAPALGFAAVLGGSLWSYDIPTGTVERWDARTYQGTFNVHVAAPPFYYGQCLTSIAAGAHFVWLTAKANSNYEC